MKCRRPRLPFLCTELIAAAALMLSTTACAPWTVVPIDDKGVASSSARPEAGAARYVDSIWSSKLVPAALNSAVDARTLLDRLAHSPEDARAKFGRHEANGPWYVVVKGEGRVVSVDTRSRVGLLQVDIAPFDGRGDVAIQIGPVLRGTALRDATGVVRFSDFVNQLQFADVANALNERVLHTVLAQLKPESLQGRGVSFTGAASVEQDAQAPIRDLVPVRLAEEERP